MFAGVHPTSSQSRTVIDGFMTGGKRTSVSYIFFHKYRTPLRGMTAQKPKNVKRPPAQGAGGPSRSKKSYQRLAAFCPGLRISF